MTTVITKAEVKKHRHRNSLWLIIHDQVYDVTDYLEEHPGGEDVLLDNAGTDATQAFEDVGHSDDARELLKKYKIGQLPDDEKSKVLVPVCCKSKSASRPKQICVKDCPSVVSCMTAHRMSKRDGGSRKGSVSGCLTANRPPMKNAVKSWHTFDAPSGSYWKWLALAALLIGAAAVGVMVAKNRR